VARIALLILSRQRDDLDLRRMCEQFGDETESFLRPMRRGRQAQIDQRQRGRLFQATHQPNRLGAIFRQQDVELIGERKTQRVANERIVVNDEQAGQV